MAPDGFFYDHGVGVQATGHNLGNGPAVYRADTRRARALPPGRTSPMVGRLALLSTSPSPSMPNGGCRRRERLARVRSAT